MTFQLEPLELGEHPTNVEATADWVDAWGHSRRQRFPVPRVTVVEPAHAIYLPLAMRERCLRRTPADIVLVVDTSNSMSRPNVGRPGTALDVAREAMRDLVDLLELPGDRVAVVSFDAQSRVVSELSGERADIVGGIDALSLSSGTRLDEGLAVAARTLQTAPAPRGRPVVIVLTDGLQSEARSVALAWGDQLRARGITTYAVGFGPEVDEDLLRRVASTPDRYHRSIGAQDLLPVYGRIGAELACPGR
jgi:Mg-chelatase subunit ChlD